MPIDETGIKSYYLHTPDIMEATDNGAASLVTYATHKEAMLLLLTTQQDLKQAREEIEVLDAKLKAVVSLYKSTISRFNQDLFGEDVLNIETMIKLLNSITIDSIKRGEK